MPLSLGRKFGEKILLQTSDGDIWIEVKTPRDESHGHVVLAIDAPPSVVIMRQEVAERRAGR